MKTVKTETENSKKQFDYLCEINDESTTPKYWDCECRHNYIHDSSVQKCEKCGAVQEEQPDSMVREVRRAGFRL